MFLTVRQVKRKLRFSLHYHKTENTIEIGYFHLVGGKSFEDENLSEKKRTLHP